MAAKMDRRRGPDEEVIPELWQRRSRQTSPASIAPYGAGMSLLFSPLEIRGRTFANRIWLAPMSQHCAHDGIVGDWHLVHLGGFAIGRVGLVMTEGTAMRSTGRLTPLCPGIWQ